MHPVLQWRILYVIVPRSNVILLFAALLAAHFGGGYAGSLALRRGWPYIKVGTVLTTALGLTYLMGLAILIWKFQTTSVMAGLLLLPVLLYVRIRIKKVVHPELRWFDNSK